MTEEEMERLAGAITTRLGYSMDDAHNRDRRMWVLEEIQRAHTKLWGADDVGEEEG